MSGGQPNRTVRQAWQALVMAWMAAGRIALLLLVVFGGAGEVRGSE